MPITIVYLTASLLFLGALPLPYGYYTFLRIVVTITLVWAAYVSDLRNEKSLLWIFGVLAILFNPVIKIILPKELWIIIDIGVGVLLLATKDKIKEIKAENPSIE